MIDQLAFDVSPACCMAPPVDSLSLPTVTVSLGNGYGKSTYPIRRAVGLQPGVSLTELIARPVRSIGNCDGAIARSRIRNAPVVQR